MKTNVKMLIFDLDNTLLCSDKTISRYTCDVLSRCRNSGLGVVFATARSEHSSRWYIEQIRPDAVISNGGALVRVGAERVYRSTLSQPLSCELLSVFLREKNVGYITAETDKGYYISQAVRDDDPEWEEYQPVTVNDFASGIYCDAYKLTVQIFDETTAKAAASRFPDVSILRFSGTDWYRFANIRADKWHGVSALLDYYGLHGEQAAVFGDDYNDVEMIKNCVGIAVENAVAEVKNAAKFICGSNDEDGPARWIDANIL